MKPRLTKYVRSTTPLHNAQNIKLNPVLNSPFLNLQLDYPLQLEIDISLNSNQIIFPNRVVKRTLNVTSVN